MEAIEPLNSFFSAVENAWIVGNGDSIPIPKKKTLGSPPNQSKAYFDKADPDWSLCELPGNFNDYPWQQKKLINNLHKAYWDDWRLVDIFYQNRAKKDGESLWKSKRHWLYKCILVTGQLLLKTHYSSLKVGKFFNGEFKHYTHYEIAEAAGGISAGLMRIRDGRKVPNGSYYRIINKLESLGYIETYRQKFEYPDGRVRELPSIKRIDESLINDLNLLTEKELTKLRRHANQKAEDETKYADDTDSFIYQLQINRIADKVSAALKDIHCEEPASLAPS